MNLLIFVVMAVFIIRNKIKKMTIFKNPTVSIMIYSNRESLLNITNLWGFYWWRKIIFFATEAYNLLNFFLRSTFIRKDIPLSFKRKSFFSDSVID